MKALIIADSEYKTEIYGAAREIVEKSLSDKGYRVKLRELDRKLNPCMGCFGCWVKKPGQCVISDGMAELNRDIMGSDAVIFLSPVVFGQFSANVKNALDRTLPNIMPFFYRRADGSTMHPQRYEKNPVQIVVGYGEGLDAEEIGLFGDITVKHRFGIGVEVYQGKADEEKVKGLFGVLGAGGKKAEEAKVQ